jgi:hypothetical protein
VSIDIHPDEAQEWPCDMDAERALVAALIQDPGAVDLALRAGWAPDDCYLTAHADLAMAAVVLQDQGRRPDPVLLRGYLGDGALREPRYVDELFGHVVTWENAGEYAGRVHDLAGRRRLIRMSRRLTQRAYDFGSSLAASLAWAEVEMAKVAATRGGTAADELLSLYQLADNTEAIEHRWLVPGMMAEQDKLILVGIEGSGKSLIGAQVGVCLASGVHPFNPALRIDPVRVLIVDLELSLGMLARRARLLRPHADAAEFDDALLRVWHRPRGIDLRTADGQAELTAVIRAHKPKLVVAGPMYKMGCAEAEGAAEFKKISDYLDEVVRDRLGCAMWLEQHAPMQQGRGARVLRPIGSVLWQQWPDFGWSLKPGRDKTRPDWYEWAYYRKPRERRTWPEHVYWRPYGQHGWPWAAQWPDHSWESPLDAPAEL